MEADLFTIRQKQRIMPEISPIDQNLNQSELNFSSSLTDLLSLINSPEYSLNDKIETLNELKNLIIQEYSKTVFKINDEIILSIFSLMVSIPQLAIYIYSFFTDIISKYPNQFYHIFQQTNIYNATVELITPEIDETYFSILNFICKTLEQIPESIEMFISLDLILRLKEMDQNRFTSKLLFIYYRSLLTEITPDFELFEYVFNFLTIGDLPILMNSLLFIRKFLDLHLVETLDPSMILNDNLSFLLTLSDPQLASIAINIYSSICAYGDSSISVLFEEENIIHRIVNFIDIYLTDPSTNDSCLSALNFLLSIVMNVKLDQNILFAFDIINCCDFKSNLILFDFENQEKIFYIILSLLHKIVLEQAKELINQEFLIQLTDIALIDQEKTEAFAKTIEMAIERYAADKDFTSMFNEILLTHDLDY